MARYFWLLAGSQNEGGGGKGVAASTRFASSAGIILPCTGDNKSRQSSVHVKQQKEASLPVQRCAELAATTRDSAGFLVDLALELRWRYQINWACKKGAKGLAKCQLATLHIHKVSVAHFRPRDSQAFSELAVARSPERQNQVPNDRWLVVVVVVVCWMLGQSYLVESQKVSTRV